MSRAAALPQGSAAPAPLPVGLAYFASALFFLACGSALLVWVAPALALGLFPLPAAIAVTHLFTLGWITLSMLGALHHFVPVALRTRLMPPHCAVVQLVVFDGGLALFVAGELALGPRAVFAGAVLVGLALAGFALRLVLAMVRVRPRGRTARALTVAAAFLLATLLYGVLLAGNQAFGWLGARRPGVLALHVHVALVGWVLLVVIAVAQRLLPMFLLTRAPHPRLGAAALALVIASATSLLAFHAAAPLLRVWLPLLLAAAGVLLFLVQVVTTFARHGLPELDTGMRLAGSGMVFTAITFALAPFALRFGWTDPHRLVMYVGCGVLASAALFVAGNYYRLVPFLVWSRRFAESDDAGGPTGPAALYSPEPAMLSLVALVSGVCVLLIALARGLEGPARFGAALFATGVLLLAWQITRVMLARR